MHSGPWKIGELAARTHLTVRTLHYYDEVGVLRPSIRTDAGHRLYTAEDVARLQRILSLRQLGFSMEDIRAVLDSPDFDLASVLDLHLARLSEQLAQQQRLHRQLTALRQRLTDGEPIPTDQFLETMEAITMIDKYLTPEQIKTLEQLREQHQETFGEHAAVNFKAFVDALRAHMQAGDDPGCQAVQTLAKERIVASQAALGDDAARSLGEGLRKMLSQESAIRERFGLDEAIFAYMGKAMAIAHR